MKKIIIDDIASIVGVSKTTVSFVINGKGDMHNISKKTQEKIFAVIDKYGYQPNYMAQNLKNGKTCTIAYLVPDFGNPFFAKIGRQIEKLLSIKGYQLIVSSTDENPQLEAKILKTLINRQVDGYIVALSKINTPLIKNLIEQNVPLVFFDRDDENIKSNYVIVENRESMKTAVRKVMQAGTKKIGLCTLFPDVMPLKERIKGYKEAFEEEGLEIDLNLICEINPNNIREETQTQIQFLMHKDVDAIVFTNNQVAAESLLHLNNSFAEKLPNLQMVTFDNLDWFDYTPYRIISLAQPLTQIAENIVDILLNKLKDKNSEAKRVVLEPKLIVR